MIIGIGYDIVDIRRIERVIRLYGERFLERVFVDSERLTCQQRRYRGACYAQRFAAKEACAKALGTGMRQGVSWRSIVVQRDSLGGTQLVLHGGAERQLRRKMQAYNGPTQPVRLHLTLSDTRLFATAFVMIDIGS